MITCLHAAAWRHHKSNLREEYKDKYADIEANRAFCPDYTWVQNEHTKYLHMKFGTLDGPDAMVRAKNIAEKYNTENGSDYVKVVQREDGHYYIVIVDQLHRRVHEVNIYLSILSVPANITRLIANTLHAACHISISTRVPQFCSGDLF